MKIGLPSATMLVLEWGSYEVLTLMAGYLGVLSTGAQVIIINTFFVFC
jgi:Na+-driven multidrug efflux pump